MKRVIGALTLSALALLARAAGAVSIVAMTPQGEVAQVRQVTVKFSDSVVAFGDPRLADPVAIACQGSVVAGSGRWANDRVWLYDFREPLGPGASCTATVRADWKPAPRAGATGPGAAASAPALTGTTRFAFSTGGPAVVSMQPGGGSEIEEDQHFLLRLNGPAVDASVVANAWCEVEGIGERLALRIVGGDVRAQLLKARRIDKTRAANMLVVRCDRPLPNGAAMRLVWGKGIAAASNPKIVSTIEQRFRFTVRAAFSADFSCERERANAPCLPIRPMSVRFTAPVPRELAAQVRLAPGRGRGACAGVRQGRQGDRGQRGRVPEAARRELWLQRRDAGDPPRQRRSSARQRVGLSAQGSDRQRAADRQVRGGAVRHRREERRGDVAGHAAPCAGRPAAAGCRCDPAGHRQRPGSRQAAAKRRGHPRLVRARCRNTTRRS